jgi:hypothetical protein
MYRKIWGTALTLISDATTEGHAMYLPAKDHAARILVSLGASYFATLFLLIFQP